MRSSRFILWIKGQNREKVNKFLNSQKLKKMYQIISKSIYGISIIDESKDLRDAQILAMRYSCDFGPEFLFKIKKGRKILFTYWNGINGNLL